MAKLKNPVLRFAGSIGNLRFREVDGEQIVQAATLDYTIVSPKVLANNNSWDLIIDIYRNTCGTKKTACAANLRRLWQNAAPPRKPLSSFFVEKNCKLVTSPEAISQALISPCENCFPFPSAELQLVNEFYRLVIAPLDESFGFNPDTENYIELAGFASITEPIEGYKDPLIICHMISVPQPLVLGQEIIIPIIFPSQSFDHYSRCSANVVLITSTAKDQPVRTSVKKIIQMKP